MLLSLTKMSGIMPGTQNACGARLRQRLAPLTSPWFLFTRIFFSYFFFCCLQLSNWPPKVRFHLRFTILCAEIPSDRAAGLWLPIWARLQHASGCCRLSNNISICLCNTMTLHPDGSACIPASWHTRHIRFHVGNSRATKKLRARKHNSASFNFEYVARSFFYSLFLTEKAAAKNWQCTRGKIEIKWRACITAPSGKGAESVPVIDRWTGALDRTQRWRWKGGESIWKQLKEFIFHFRLLFFRRIKG